MRYLLTLLTALFLASTGQAQVYGIWFNDAKAEKKYKKHLTELNGAMVLVCEPYRGIVFDRERNTISYHPESNEVFVADPADPTFVPYVFEDGERKPRGRNATLRVNGKHIGRVQILMPRQSLLGLSREYQQRRGRLDQLVEERDAHPKGSRDWMEVQVRVLSSYAKLSSWLGGTTYTVAAEKLRKEVARQQKLSSGEAIEARLERGLASVKILEPPPELVEASKAVTAGSVSFGVGESEHVRIVFDRAGVDDVEIKKLLIFAETAIDGFRRDHVDPYLAEDFPDHIPDRLFLEFWIGPDDLARHERFYTEYYGLEWGNNKEQRLAVRGQTKRRQEPPEYLDYGKREDHDLMGVVAHRVGHVLAALHFNANDGEMKQDWLEEALAYHIAFEYFGRNEETCYAFKGEGDRYSGGDSDESNQGQVQILLGERYVYNQLALKKGRSIDSLAPMTIFSMGDADLAKGWSFFDYVARVEGEKGQRWLRDACALARAEGPRFVVHWRESSAELWGIPAGDVFRELEGRWRAHAEAEQKVDF